MSTQKTKASKKRKKFLLRKELMKAFFRQAKAKNLSKNAFLNQALKRLFERAARENVLFTKK